MFKSLKQISFLKCITNDALRLSPRTAHNIQIFRWKSGLKEEKAEPLISLNEDLSFMSYLQLRREQAQRSLIMRVPNTDVFPDVMNCCGSFGKIRNIFQFRHNFMHFLLIEMETEAELNNFIRESLRIHHNSSYFNHFLTLNSKKLKLFSSAKDSNLEKNISSANIIEVKSPQHSKLSQEMYRKYESLTQLIMHTYENFKINDLGVRKKFLMCRQIEILCSGFLPNVVAYPFGSSVTGYGFNFSDLDISIVPLVKEDSLFYQENYLNLEMEKVRVHINVLSDFLKCFMPGCQSFFLVKNARVPILKFKNSYTEVECDLSLYNLHGVAMSNILYTIGLIDWRIRPLIIFMKQWAQMVGLVVKSPSPSISNFSLCLLVLFFLQQIKIVPPLNIFPRQEKQLASSDLDLTELNSFLSKNRESGNYKSLGSLFLEFFEYYDSFNFQSYGINVNTGEPMKNLTSRPLHIDNPLLPGVNVSKNVNANIMNRTKMIIKDVLQILAEDENEDENLRDFKNLLKLNIRR